MNFNISEFSKVLTSINANIDLDQNNIINKIKEMVQEEYPSIYQEWQDNEFDINHLFSVLSHKNLHCCT